MNAILWITELLCSLGQTVMISNFQEYYKVVEYFLIIPRPEWD
jgi:hypothetical protein